MAPGRRFLPYCFLDDDSALAVFAVAAAVSAASVGAYYVVCAFQPSNFLWAESLPGEEEGVEVPMMMEEEWVELKTVEALTTPDQESKTCRLSPVLSPLSWPGVHQRWGGRC